MNTTSNVNTHFYGEKWISQHDQLVNYASQSPNITAQRKVTVSQIFWRHVDRCAMKVLISCTFLLSGKPIQSV